VSTNVVVVQELTVTSGRLLYKRNEYGRWTVRSKEELPSLSPILWENGSSLELARLGLTPAAAGVLAEVLARYERHKDLIPPTRVASVKGLTAAEAGEKGIVYVGRAVRRRDGLGADGGAVRFNGHPLGNPFKPAGRSKEALTACVSRYEEYVRANPERLALAKALRGRLLGCWCGSWDGAGAPTFQCHALVLAKIADE